MNIDVHQHALPERALDLFKRDPVYGVTIDGRTWQGGNHVDFTVKPEFTDTAAKLAQMDALDLDAGIVSGIPPLFYYELDAGAGAAICAANNLGLKEMAAESGGRLWWMAHVPLQDPKRAATMVEEAAADGAVGLHVGTSIAGRRLDEPDFDVFWQAAARAGLPVEIHPDFTYDRHPALSPYYLNNVVGLPLETTLTIERLICAGVLDRHPDLRIVLLHAGGFFPYQAGRLRHAHTVRPELADSPADPWTYFGQVVVDAITHDPEALRYLISRVGADNVLLGTDLPFDMAPPDPMGLVRAATDDPEILDKVAGANATRLYGLKTS
jgi:aminocarboxymuconate-semialdehyde decarboxylase